MLFKADEAGIEPNFPISFETSIIQNAAGPNANKLDVDIFEKKKFLKNENLFKKLQE